MMQQTVMHIMWATLLFVALIRSFWLIDDTHEGLVFAYESYKWRALFFALSLVISTFYLIAAIFLLDRAYSALGLVGIIFALYTYYKMTRIERLWNVRASN